MSSKKVVKKCQKSGYVLLDKENQFGWFDSLCGVVYELFKLACGYMVAAVLSRVLSLQSREAAGVAHGAEQTP